MALSTQDTHETPDRFWRVVAKRAEADVVSDEIADDHGMKTPTVALVFVEPDAPHAIGQEIRRLLGIEKRYNDIAPELARTDTRGHRQGEGDRRGVIVGTRSVDHAVVMGADQQGRERLVATGDHSYEIRETGPPADVRQRVVFALVRFETALP